VALSHEAIPPTAGLRSYNAMIIPLKAMDPTEFMVSTEVDNRRIALI